MALDFAALLKAEREAAVAAMAAPGRDGEDERLACEGVRVMPPQLPPPAPRRVHYLPDFLDADMEADLLQKLTAGDKGWARLSKRRLLNCGGTPHPSGMFVEDLAPPVEALCDRLLASGVFGADHRPNQLLINAYEPGTGISPHQDGPLYEPMAAIVSLGQPAVMDFWQPGPEGNVRVASVVMQPRSLLVFAEDVFCVLKHGIADVDTWTVDDSCINAEAAGVAVGDRVCVSGERVSVTVRRVKNVSKHVRDLVTPEDLAEKRRRDTWWHDALNEK